MATVDGQERKSRRLMNLFGLPFLLVGLGVLIFSPLETLYRHWASSDWPTVPATLEQLSLKTHSGDDSTTYSIEARYRYRFQGQDYVSTRVGYDWGSDNIGSYHSQTVSDLRRDQGRGQLRAWVNPQAPAESYLRRDLRWPKLVFGTVFGLIFAVAGLAVMLVPRLKGRRRAAGGTELIDSNERRGFWVWAFMGFMFLGVSLPATLATPDEIQKGNWAILIALVFPLAGLWMAAMAWKQWRLWRFYGPMPLALEPWPGQLGGDVAGTVPVSHYRGEASYRFTLQCLKITVSGSGKNRSRSERLLWEDHQYPHVEMRGEGVALRFLFTPPSDLPETLEEGRTRYQWRLLLTGPRQPQPLQRSWSVPVTAGALTAPPLPASHVRDAERREQIEAATELAEQIDVQPLADGVQLDSRVGRHKGMTVMLVLMGVVFSASAGFLFQQAASEGAMLYFMAFMFGLFGVPMLLGGLFVAGRSLSVRIQGEQVTLVRSWAGFRLWQRSGTLSRAEQLVLKDAGSMSQGHQHTRYFHLEARGSDGRRLRLAEGIADQDAAEALKRELVRLLRLP